jgi:uncharacterized cupin superfamily protein
MQHVIHEGQVTAKELPGRSHKMIIGPAPEMLGCQSMCFGVADFPPQAHAPGHRHDSQEEIIYILTGEGAIFFDGQPEVVRPGSCVFVPAGVNHSIRNDSDHVMKLTYCFSPPVIQGSYG